MKKLIISGFGGQGVLSLGLLVSYSAMNMDLNTSWLPSYGPEMRGGTANVSVAYSDGEIACPLVSRPDVLTVFNEPSLAKFESAAASGGYIFVNSSIVAAKVKRTDVKAVYVPVDEIAAGINPKGGNIIMLGAMLAALDPLTYDAVKRAVEKVFESKPKLVAPNIACLDAGIKYFEEKVRPCLH